ncbi:MAG: diacylglycerol kinase family protein [Candidatus Promineifilaceae bacterium]|nr:diacylglycerol kinase family protein [Candidatus Promineifilaceae bacterium]
MKATLIYNQNARQTDQVTVETLQNALRAAGYYPVYTPTLSEEDVDEALADATGGLVVAAGGDGTVRAVATRLLDRDAVLTILPLGTANNIARTLGIEGDPLELVDRLADPVKCAFDVGRVTAPWGTHYFLEALGFGFYADTLVAYEPEKEKSVLRAVRAFTQTLPDYQARPFTMVLDGNDISGDFLLVEVLNTTAFGPRLKVAPEADVGDGLFEVIRVRARERDSFVRYMLSLVAEELDELPSVEVSRGKRLEVVWTGFPLHVDGELHPDSRDRMEGGAAEEAELLIEVMPQALDFWLPAQNDEA